MLLRAKLNINAMNTFPSGMYGNVYVQENIHFTLRNDVFKALIKVILAQLELQNSYSMDLSQ